MNRGDLRTAIRSVLMEPAAARWGDADINGYINNAIAEVSRALLRKKTAEVSVLAGTETVTLPSDCAVPTDLFWNDDKIARVLDEEIPTGSDTGTPDRYWLIDDVVYFRPIPDEDGSAKFVYYYNLPSLSTDTDSPALDGLDNFIKAHGVYEAYFDDSDPRYELWNQRRAQELAAFLSLEASKYSIGFKVKERF
jgi:hypothetical protein